MSTTTTPTPASEKTNIQQTKPNNELVLRIWPSLWDLPSFTPECIAAVMYLQRTLPGDFVVEECINPDLSPNGCFPYIVHGETYVASFLSIVKYVEGLSSPRHGPSDTDGDVEYEEENVHASGSSSVDSLTPRQRARQTAWLAFVSSNLGDLVACSLFSLRHNYNDFTRRALAHLFPLPLKYYVPDRIRDSYRPRLETADLWAIHAEEVEEERQAMTAEAQVRAAREKGLSSLARQSSINEAFGKEKVLDKARESLTILSNLLDSNASFQSSGASPSSLSVLDIAIAAHILILSIPNFPNDLLSKLVKESYPSLYTHGLRVQASLLPNASRSLSASLSSSYELVRDAQSPPPTIDIRKASSASFSQLILSTVYPFPRASTAPQTKAAKGKSTEDVEFDRMRWAWYGLAALGVVGWVWATGLRIVVVRADSDDDEGEEEGEEDDEGEDDGIAAEEN